MAKRISEKTTKEILEGSLVKAIMALAIPVIVNSFLQTMYNLTDTYWLGKLGTDELAAINLVSPLQNIVVNFGGGLTVAGSVLLARYVGAGKFADAKSMANQIFTCAMIFSATMSIVICVLAPIIVTWLGAEELVKEYAITYIRIVILDMPFLYCVNMFQSINQAQGDTVKSMLLNLLGITVNLICDPLFMIGLKLGVAGAALATVFAKLVPAIIAYTNLVKKDKNIYLDLSKLKFERDKIRNIITIGLPSAIGGSTMQFGFLLMSRNVLEYGKVAMAAYGIGNKINGLISLPSNGIGSAVATIVSQNIGAGKYDRAERGYKLSMRAIVIFLAIGGFILSRPAISRAMVSIFSDKEDVIVLAADFLSIMAFWCFCNGVHNCTMGLFQGSGHTEVTMAIDVARLWVFRFATLYVCGSILHMGVRSVWYSVVISNGISPAILYIIYKTGYWKKSRV